MFKGVKTEYKPNTYIYIRDLHHLRSPLFIYLFLLFGHAMNLGICETTKCSSGAHSIQVKGVRICGVHYENTLNLDTLRHGIVT